MSTPSEMVETQLRKRGIRDQRVLDAISRVPRHLFVPEEQQGEAYEDRPLPIGQNQTISQPYIVAFMTEKLDIRPTDRVLEIGTGSGYQTAILAELAEKVYTVEIVTPLYKDAKERMRQLGYSSIDFKIGDGRHGWPEHAPYDKIIVTAAAEKIPETLVEQLKEGGKFIVPVGEIREVQELLVGIKVNGDFRVLETMPVRFVPLIHETEAKSKEQGHGRKKSSR